ncbi:prevent-host-death family protein [Conyzicola lurida]|uniref:Antitoxin n=1 Tax=Conyzicola lurida TaxID=1172621 RepID=A0A841AGR8_9MICO|nr:type II toxin-antitoxin system Phd/YefM family antitoxin [Conyzicola lurida]MBB5842407.1 prevent-host-death family protein [Conyzicola lurida]
MMTLSIAEARATFSKIVDAAETTHERFDVTRNGRRAAVLLGADDYDALMETLAILGDSALVATIGAGLAELDAGETVGIVEVENAMRRAGRLRE